MLRDMDAADVLTPQTCLVTLDLMLIRLRIVKADSMYLSVEDVDAAVMKH